MVTHDPEPVKQRTALVFLAKDLPAGFSRDASSSADILKRGLEIIQSVPGITLPKDYLSDSMKISFLEVSGTTEAIERLRIVLMKSGIAVEYNYSEQPFAAGSSNPLADYSFSSSQVEGGGSEIANRAREIAREVITPEVRNEARRFFNLDGS